MMSGPEEFGQQTASDLSQRPYRRAYFHDQIAERACVSDNWKVSLAVSQVEFNPLQSVEANVLTLHQRCTGDLPIRLQLQADSLPIGLNAHNGCFERCSQ